MEISLTAEKLFQLGSLPVTNTTVMTVAVSALIIGTSLVLKSKLKTVPKGFQNIVEYVFEAFLNLTESITQNKKQTQKIFPLIMTLFIFIILSNWVELLPGLGTIGLREAHEGKAVLIPFLRSSSADLNMTLALSLIAVFSIQFAGIATIGAVKYGKKFFISPLREPYVIGTFVGLLELIGEFTKIISFSFRLFGNIFAGEVLLMVILNLVPYVLPLPFLLMEIFVGFIQALVFAMLTLVFIKMATVEAEH